MILRNRVLGVILGGTLLCGSFLFGQEPVQDIDKRVHPNLAAAQMHVVEANREIVVAQKDNNNDMRSHAEKARALLAQANQELKLAVQAANAVNNRKKK
ncbi:MAG: hypothetical protein H0X25_07610 [Acidobacteriales bacterium]|nr:hypothetical protein [Terriglobales bacterium]